MNWCRFVSASFGFFLVRSAIRISTVNTFSMSLVHLMFLKCSSVSRQPPSLLSGSLGADSPPFIQYYEAAKTAFAPLLAFGFPRFGYHLCYRLFFAFCVVTIKTPLNLDCWGSVNPQLNRLSGGGGRLSCVPVLPQSTFDMVSDPGRIAPACLISFRWFDIAPIMSTIKASALNVISRFYTYLQ